MDFSWDLYGLPILPWVSHGLAMSFPWAFYGLPKGPGPG